MSVAVPPVVLTIRPLARTAVHVVLVDTLVVGRDCDGFLLADAQVSRRHVEFSRIGDRVLVTDLQSANGMLLNGDRAAGEVEVSDGDVVTIGTTDIVVGSLRHTFVAHGDSVAVDRPKTSVELLAEEVEPGAVARELRSEGTFTIVFSDIKGSTAYATNVGDQAWMAILDRHNEIVRSALADASGREVKSQGDGFMLSFDSARRAVEFAIAVQRQLERERSENPTWDVRVRIGVHSGEAIATSDGDLFGRHVIIAARVADKADGGEIFATSLVREICSGREGFAFGEGTTVSLKGIGDQVIHRVDWKASSPPRTASK